MEQMMTQLLTQAAQQMSSAEILKTLGFAGVLALILFCTYRFSHSKNSYQPNFAVTLVIMAFVSTILMDLIQSNLALSLGMLGSLSIVRFRTNIRDPRDIGFIIWSMAIGLIAATMSLAAGLLGSAVLAAVMIITKKDETQAEDRLLVVRGSSVDLDEIQKVLDHCTGTSRVKAKNILSDSFELVYEVNISDEESNKMIETIFHLGDIDAVNLLAQGAID